MTMTTKILIWMAAGLMLGSLINAFASDVALIQDYFVNGLFHVVGAMFITGLKMLVVPLVTFSLICGVYGIGDIAKLGRVGVKAFGLFILTTTLAITLAITVAGIVGPGQGFELTGEQGDFTAPVAPPLTEVIINLVPSNPVAAYAEGNMLQIIFFTILFAVCMLMVGEPGRKIAEGAERLNKIMMQVVTVVMHVAPYGVFALIAWTTGKFGLDILLPMGKLIVATLVACLVHILVSYTLIVTFVARISPVSFLKKVMEPALVGLSTCSAAAAFPFSMRAQKQLGVSPKVFGFTLPMALTINMDGTALYQAVAATFVANAFGIDLTLTQQGTIVLTAVLASVGTASIPGGGLIMLTMVLESVGLPLEGIAIVAGIDRILDMFRTTTNIFGDNSSGVVVAALGGELNREIAATPLADLEAEKATAQS